MGKVNIKGVIDKIKKTNIYTPIIEVIVNAIQAIEEKKYTKRSYKEKFKLLYLEKAQNTQE